MSPTDLADAILGRVRQSEDSFVAQGVVTAFDARSVTVSVAGQSAGTWPLLRSYTPAVGDVAVLVGPPGSWVAIGALA